MVPSQFAHPDMTLDIQNVRSLANHKNQQKCAPSGNSQLAPAQRCISILAWERDSSEGGGSVASIIEGQNSVPSSLLSNSHIAEITQRVTSTPSAKQRLLLNTPNATLGNPAPGGTSQTDSTCRIVSSPTSGIASTPAPLSGFDNMPTPIPNPEACAINTNPLQTRATDRKQRQRQ
jgi:hypothetical protein